MNNKHDKGYKYLLSVKKIFVQLLRSFVKQGWVEKIDENSVILVDKSFILQDFKDKEADLVYRVKLDGKEVVFFLLLELQSTVDFQMPYRLLLYMVEIWRVIFKDAGTGGGKKEFKLPAIIPCVLYNGKDNWTVCRSFRETIEANELFGEYILDFKYILFDVNRYDKNRLLELTNLIGAVFYIDQSQNYDELFGKLKNVSVQFSKLDDEAQILFFTWLKNIALRGISQEKAEELKRAFEGNKEGICMVYAVEEIIRNEIKNREEIAISKGFEKGIEQGIERTAKNLLNMGISVEQVVKGTGLSHERVQEIRQSSTDK
ncbi:MAG: Rpn family recombination-promoting nuclease/putative transposase [Ruminiclostridium sp.]|nr:Rpn family recombination-promoting nuclease/putative transposase [Ruminiclostridium sp.]